MDVAGPAVLRSARERSGPAQAELGMRAGVPQSAVSAYGRGRREPSMAVLRRLVAAAGLDLEIAPVPRASVGRALVGPIGRRVQRHRDEARRMLIERSHADPAVFGSLMRGEDGQQSDLDLLVDLPAIAGLTELSRMAIDLETLLGVRVDLVPRSASRPRVTQEIADDLVPL